MEKLMGVVAVLAALLLTQSAVPTDSSIWDELRWRASKLVLRGLPILRTENAEERALALLSRFPLVDGHADVPLQLRMQFDGDVHRIAEEHPVKTVGTYLDGVHVDIPKLKTGRVGMQVWAAWVPPETADQDAVSLGLQQVEITLAAVEAHPSALKLVLTPQDAEAAFYQGKVGIMVGLEGGGAIGNNLEVLRLYHRLGMRIFTVTHTASLPWCSACSDTPFTEGVAGLSHFGRRVVAECNRLGVVVDLSHASAAAQHDVLSASAAPVVWSHSNAAALAGDVRNVPEDVLDRVVENGGLVMPTLPERFLVDGAGKGAVNFTSVDDLVRHIHYLVERVGVDHVGFGSDFDGCTSLPHGLTHAGEIPNLITALVRSGRYSDADMAKLMGGNFLRVWREVEVVAASWTKPPLHGPETSLYTSAASNKAAPECHYQWSTLRQGGFK